jgi:hypothetical protein
MAFAESPALDFGATWAAVLAVLQAEADDGASALHELGLTRDAVVAGELGRSMPMAPPFVYVFLIPTGSDGMRATDGVPHAPAAALRVFCGVEPEDTTYAAVVRAMALGAAVLDVLRRRLADAGIHARYDGSPLRLDSYTSKLAVCEVAGSVYYSLAVVTPERPPAAGSSLDFTLPGNSGYLPLLG